MIPGISPAAARNSFLRIYVLGAVFLTLFAGTVQVVRLQNSYDLYRDRAQVTAQNMGKVLATSISGMFQTVDASLFGALELKHQMENAGPIDAATFNKALQDMAQHVPGLIFWHVTNAAGDLKFGTQSSGDQVSVGDRNYFQRLRNDPAAGMVVSEPLMGRVSKDWVVICARRITGSDGRFMGVMQGSIAVDGIADRLLGQDINLGDQVVFTLINDEGVVITRYSHKKQDLQFTGKKLVSEDLRQWLRDGAALPLLITAHPKTDDIERIFYAQAVPGMALRLIVGLPTADAYESWHGDVKFALINTVLLVSLLGSGFYLAYRSQKRQEDLLEDLTDALNLNQKVIDHAMIGLHVFRRDGQCVVANAAAAAIVGARQEELLQQNFRHLASWNSIGAVDLAEQTLATGATHHNLSKVTTSFGKAVYLQWVMTSFNYRRSTHLLMMMRDVSDIQLAKESLEESNKRLIALSETDGLTGIANRRRFDEVLSNEWRRAERGQQSLALAMLDVDHFKKYNDRYGHLQGDDCLRRVADILRGHCVRAGDVVARYGGEEFAFIAPATEGANAYLLAESIRSALQNLALPHAAAESGHVSVSIGVAALVPSSGLTPEMLIEQADQALYNAKKKGRNRVMLADPAAEPLVG